MAFQIKDFLSIVAAMINHARGTTDKLTDFNVGSINRTMMESPAVEIDELYQQMFIGLKESIPTAIYLSFNFSRLPASAAFTNVTFTASPAPAQAIVIPAQTEIRVPGATVSFFTDTQVQIPAAQTTVTVRATANTTGTVANTLANTITEILVPISTVTVSNANPVTSGTDTETDDERKVRFNQFIAALSRGPLASIEFGARTAFLTDASGNVTERATNALVIEPYVTDNNQPLGYVDCYVYNGVGGTSAALIAEAQKIVDGYTDAAGARVMGWKAAGVIATVQSVIEQQVAVTAVLAAESGVLVSDLLTPVTDAIRAYLTALDIGETAVRAEIIRVIMAVDGVYNVTLSVPAADVVPAATGTKILPGTITVS